MRITRTLLNFKKALSAKARCPQNPDKVPFAKMGPILPLKLKNRVSGKVDSQKQVACLHEMSILFAAMKDNDFNEKKCKKEFEALKKANIDAMNKAREEKLKNAGQISTIGNKLNSNQLNKYLKNFPE